VSELELRLMSLGDICRATKLYVMPDVISSTTDVNTDALYSVLALNDDVTPKLKGLSTFCN
jgi:hypothetical protein